MTRPCKCGNECLLGYYLFVPVYYSYELDNHMNNELLPAIKLAEDEKVAIDRKCSEIGESRV